MNSEEKDKFKYVLSNAKDSSTMDMVRVGEYYIEGYGTKVDVNEGLKWFNKALPRCSTETLMDIAKFLDEHKLKDKSFDFYAAAAHENVDAMVIAGCGYWDKATKLGYGKDIDKNVYLRMAEDYLRKAKDKGNPRGIQKFQEFAQYRGGDLLKEATSLLHSNSDAVSTRELGRRYLHAEGVTRDNNKAFELFKKASAMGDVDATYLVGYCYYHGYGVMKTLQNYAIAFDYFNKAADKGSALAKMYVGIYYLGNNGIPANYTKAFNYFTEAANTYDPVRTNFPIRAKYYLGLCYQYGYGTYKDMDKAAHYYKLASNNGDMDAKWRYGVYLLGTATIHDMVKDAINNYIMVSAKSGNAWAQYHLGILYLEGGNYVLEKDREMAKYYLTKSANNGCSAAKDKLKYL